MGCTEDFKEQLDYIVACLGRLALDNNVIILGDLNANPSSEGGPLSSITINEQGRILLWYLKRDFVYDILESSPNQITY